MTNTILLAFFFALSLLSLDNEKPVESLKADAIQKGFLPIGSNLYLQQCEVSNADYQLFLQQLKFSGNHQQLAFCLPDTAQWQSIGGQAFAQYYHAHSAYRLYPAVTISFEAAEAYCRWLTEQYLQDANRTFKSVVFRLPTEAEWMVAANDGEAGTSYPWGDAGLQNKKGQSRCNYFRPNDELITYDPASHSYKVVTDALSRRNFQSPVKSFAPTGKGFYNLAGNVAEMTAEKGIAKGGSFRDPGYDVQNKVQKMYTAPSPEIGFRVLMEVIED